MQHEIGQRVRRIGRLPGERERRGVIVAKVRSRPAGTKTQAEIADWFTYDVRWDDSAEVGRGYLPCGLEREPVMVGALVV